MAVINNHPIISGRIPEAIRQIDDPFSRELIELWDIRHMKGKTFYVGDRGYILLQDCRKHWTIRGFFVQPEDRGKGLGSVLLANVCDFVDGQRQDCFVNITKGAESIYVRHGFEIIGPRLDFPDQLRAIRRHKP